MLKPFRKALRGKGVGCMRKRAIYEDDSMVRGRVHQLFHARPGDRIEDEARALAAGDLIHFLNDVFFFGGDHVGGAERKQFGRAYRNFAWRRSESRLPHSRFEWLRAQRCWRRR